MNKKQFYMTKTRMVLLALLALLTGTSAKADTITESFEEWGNTPAEGWTLINDALYGNSYAFDYVVNDDYTPSDGTKTLWNTSHSGAGTTASPMIVTPSMTGTLTFKFRKYNSSSSTKGYISIFEYDETNSQATGSSVWTCKPNGINEATSKYQNGSINVGEKPKRYAIYLSDVCIDEFCYTPAAAAVEGAGLAVSGYLNGSTFAFGMVNPNATAELTILNPGTAEVNVTVSTTGGYSATPSTLKIAAKGSEKLTLTAPATTADGTLTLTPAETGVEAITLTLTASVKDPEKMYIDFNDNALPDDWETVQTGTSASSVKWSFANGYAEYAGGSMFGRYYDMALVSPVMIFSEGEKVVFQAKSTGNYTPYMVVEYYDGTTWTAAEGGTFDGVFNTFFASYEVAVPATAKQIRFNGASFAIDDIYGGKLDNTPRPKLAVDGIANGGTLSWGYQDVPAGSEKTITLLNAGTADLSVEMTATDDFTVSPATGTVPAQGQLEVKIGTPAHDGNGTLTIKPAEGSGLAEYTITLTSYWKEPLPNMVIANEERTIDFGTLNTEATQTVTVQNTGDAELTATIACDNTDNFEVTPQQLTVAAGESAELTVKYKYVEGSYGRFTANISVTPNKGDAVQISVVATSKNPNLWTEDFEAGEMPAFWQNNGFTVQTVNESAMAKASSTANATLVTPRLKATKDEVLAFDVFYPWSDESLTIEYSADDMQTWETISNYKPENDGITDNNTTKRHEFTAPAAGNYYVRFSGKYAAVDNFEGFNLDLPDHILAINSYEIPATMKEGYNYTAKVTVAESRGVNENVVASLLLNNKVIATEEATVNANSTLTISLDFTPEAAENAEMRIEVAYADNTLTLSTATVARTIEASTKLELSEDNENTIEAGTYDVVTLHYTLHQGWNTLCLPFMLNVAELGEGAKAFSFYDYQDGVLRFSPLTTDKLAMQTPYVVFSPADKELAITMTSTTIYADAADVANTAVTHNGITLQGTYAPYSLTADNYGVTNRGNIKQGDGTANSSVKAFRAYFTGITPEVAARLTIDFEGMTTGIKMIGQLDNLQSDNCYDLSGRKMAKSANGHMTKGLYIVNGKKVIVK